VQETIKMRRFIAVSKEDRVTILIFIADNVGLSLDKIYTQSIYMDLINFKAFCKAALSLPR